MDTLYLIKVQNEYINASPKPIYVPDLKMIETMLLSAERVKEG
ncbi:hypothetical protein [Gracilibacillus sp. YIM 98692]|nr:hypothetical protein [Gracilibacillus sp. YIM 98692]